VHYVDRIAYLSQTGEIDQSAPAKSVLGRLSISNPLSLAAQTLGLSPDLNPATLSELKRVLSGVTSPAYPPSNDVGRERLTAKGLSFAYDGIDALKDAHMQVNEGEIIALLGRNGAGKSTFLRCLMGLLRAQKGEVWLDGQRVNGGPVCEMARKMAYVPQWPSELLFADSVMEELTFTLHNHGLLNDPPIPPSELLEKMGLAETADRYPRDLSAGQKQRVALAAVLVTKPGVILLDEPTLGMDLDSKDVLGNLLLQWKGEGAGIVVATHDVEFIAKIADHVVILEEGRVVASGPTAETLFSRREFQTALQQFSGRAYPATIRDLQKSLMMRGEGDADDGAGTRMV
jgi:energy-coupling factor transporter ATP-binding protein EcfA2